MLIHEFMYFLPESLNSGIQPEWKHENGHEVGYFIVDDQQYGIIMEYGVFPVMGKDVRFANVTFFVLKNGDKDYSLQFTGKYAGTVFSTIVGSVRRKIEEHSLDALLFAAIHSEGKRMSTYNAIAQRYAKDFGVLVPDIKTPGGTMTIAINKKAFGDKYQDFVKYAKELKFDK